MAAGRTEIAGSSIPRAESTRQLQPADPNRVVEATIVIRRPNRPVPSAGATRADIERSLSAEPSDIDAVADYARRAGFTVIEASPTKSTVRVEGAVRNMNHAFGVELGSLDGGRESPLSYAGPISVES